MQKATLLLDDGTRIEGEAAGVPGATVGELSVYTSHDYMNRITDPSSAGQICAFTMPEVGIWGVNTEHCETGKPWIRGVITRNIASLPSNWRSAETLDFYLRRNLIIGITGIDTAGLAAYAAKKGIRKCAIVSSPGFNGWDALLTQVKAYRYDNTFPAAVKAAETYGPAKGVTHSVAMADFGASRRLVALLNSMRVRVTLLPPYDAATIVSRGGYDALILPQGPGSPRSHPGITESIHDLIKRDGTPILGMGLGFGFVATAYGARVTRMHDPHRGAWYPVTDMRSGVTVYTKQYHEYTVDPELPLTLTQTHRCPTDGSVEGVAAKDEKVLAVQYLPCSDLRLGGTGELLFEFFSLLK